MYEIGTALHILIMNVEAFSTTKGMDFANKFLSCHRTMMAIDESTTLKHQQQKELKIFLNLAVNKQVYRRIMTGSPVTKNPLDLYTQCDFLSPWFI